MRRYGLSMSGKDGDDDVWYRFYWWWYFFEITSKPSEHFIRTNLSSSFDDEHPRLDGAKEINKCFFYIATVTGRQRADHILREYLYLHARTQAYKYTRAWTLTMNKSKYNDICLYILSNPRAEIVSHLLLLT